MIIKFKRFKKQRMNLGLSQITVQMKTGIDQSELSKIERGLRYPSVLHCRVLARLYNTSIDYLLELTDEITPYKEKENISRVDEDDDFYYPL